MADQVDQVETLRSALEAARGGRTHWTYPRALRERVTAFARGEIESRGRTALSVAEELGMSQTGLSRWLRHGPSPDRLPGRFRPVEVVPSATGSPGSPVLITPSGYRVEGLRVDELAALLPRL